MLLDIHSHTFYSHCGRDDPHVIINRAIEAGLDVYGICDHNHGIIGRLDEEKGKAIEKFKNYLDLLSLLKNEYKEKINIWRGIEICTMPDYRLPDYIDISGFDYALIECVDLPGSIISPVDGVSRVFEYSKKLGCRCGIAHTDLFAFCKNNGFDKVDFFNKMKEYNIFWEMNVSYDSIHGYREHQYVKTFIADEYQQEVIRNSKIQVSVGFDGHRIEDYRPDRVIQMCNFLEEKNIPIVTLN